MKVVLLQLLRDINVTSEVPLYYSLAFLHFYTLF